MAKSKVDDEALRGHVLDAAERIVARGGIAALSAKTLAKEAAVSSGTITAFFPNTQTLVSELYTRAFEIFGESQRSIVPTDDPERDLEDLGIAYWQWAIAHPHQYQAMFGGSLLEFDSSLAFQHRAHDTMRPLLAAITRCIEAGILEGDAIAISFAAWAKIHGAVTLTFTDHNPFPPALQYSYVQNMLRRELRGWTPEA